MIRVIHKTDTDPEETLCYEPTGNIAPLMSYQLAYIQDHHHHIRVIHKTDTDPEETLCYEPTGNIAPLMSYQLAYIQDHHHH
ncbi:hypothetical protein KMB89_gp62 [Citrobacter phage HCF1]|uniref:Uncharacterized protein n=1 Tax=Citrobacter phage HCF1 TaxID=2849700 RepID=A0ABX6D791_9CAUD|nr:hypothetical protein KMB89_gp62 [Citrobacter phage HCF1]